MAAVLKSYDDLVGVFHDMIVGDDVSTRIDDEARPQGGAGERRTFAAPLLEEAAQEFVERRRRQPALCALILGATGGKFGLIGSSFARSLNCRYVDYGGHHPFHHGRKARQ